MRILITGDRNWRNATRIREVLRYVTDGLGQADYTLIEGEAMGADIIGAVVWELDYPYWPIERYPADWNTHGRAAGPIRNQEMLDSGVDYVVGFHNDIENSRGTRDMLDKCARADIPGRLFSETDEVMEWQTLVRRQRRSTSRG